MQLQRLFQRVFELEESLGTVNFKTSFYKETKAPKMKATCLFYIASLLFLCHYLLISTWYSADLKQLMKVHVEYRVSQS